MFSRVLPPCVTGPVSDGSRKIEVLVTPAFRSSVALELTQAGVNIVWKRVRFSNPLKISPLSIRGHNDVEVASGTWF